VANLLLVSWLVVWCAAGISGAAVFRQKNTFAYHPLPALVRRHVFCGVAWALVLLASGLAVFATGDLCVSGSCARVWLALLFGVVVLAVSYTGYGLNIGKPSGVWVHVLFVLVATGLAAGWALQHLGNLLT